MIKTEAEVKADKEFGQFLIMNSQVEYKGVHSEVLGRLKPSTLKRLPVFEEKKKTSEVLTAVAKLMSEMVQHTFDDRDDLHTSLEIFLKLLSYNPQLPKEYTSK